MNAAASCITLFRRRLALVLLGKYALAFATPWLFLWGTLILILRASTNLPVDVLLWGAVTLPLCLVAGGVLAWRQLPPTHAIRALLDQRNHLGGVLMAADETRAGTWENNLKVRRVPRVQWECGSAWLLFVVGLIFVLAGLCAPQHFAAARDQPLEIGHEIQRARDQVEALEKEKLLGAERAEELKKELDRLQGNARGRDPARTLEAIREVKEQAAKLAQGEIQQARAQAEKLADAEKRLEQLKSGPATEQNRKEAQELARRVAEARKENDKQAGKMERLARAGLVEREQADILARMKPQALTRTDTGKENKPAVLNGPPKVEPGGQTSGALAGSTSGRGSTQTETVLPRHRGAVERYFERDRK